MGFIDDYTSLSSPDCAVASGCNQVTLRIVAPAVNFEEKKDFLRKALEQINILCGIHESSIRVTVDCSEQALYRHVMRMLLQVNWLYGIRASFCGINSGSMRASNMWRTETSGHLSEVSIPFNYFLSGLITTPELVSDLALFEAFIEYLENFPTVVSVALTEKYGTKIDFSKLNIWFQFLQFIFTSPNLMLFDCSHCVSANLKTALAELMGLCAGLIVVSRNRVASGKQAVKRLLVVNSLETTSLLSALDLRMRTSLRSGLGPTFDFLCGHEEKEVSR